MKKRKIGLLIFLIGMILLGSNVYQENKVITQKKDVQDSYADDSNDGFYIDNFLSVYKTDESGNSMDVDMRLVLPNDFASVPLTNNNWDDDGEFYYNTDNTTRGISKTEMFKILTNEEKEIIESVHTPADLDRLIGRDKFFCLSSELYDTDGEDEYYTPAVCRIPIATVLKLEETRVPNGYSKKKLYIPGLIVVSYKFPNLELGETISPEDELELSSIEFSTMMNGYSMEYGTVPKEELQGFDLENVVKTWTRKGTQTDCSSTRPIGNSDATARIAKQGFSSAILDFYENYDCPVELVNEKGETKLDIKLSVNDKVTITTSVEQKLEFKVSVSNTGTLDAYDNTIRAKLPEGFRYVEGSASNGGTYQDGMIVWTVDLLKKGKNINLTYEAYAPKGININDSFIGEAVVVNDSIEGNYVEANKTYIKLSLNNPKTYTPIGIIILVLGLSGIGLGSILKPKKQK